MHWTQIRPVNLTYLNLLLLVKFVFLNKNSLFSNTSVVVCLLTSSLICYH